jgi:pyridoxal phosphate enzyme (YggS family)
MTDVGARVKEVRTRMTRAAQQAGRRAEDVTLIAISKTFSVDRIAQAIEAGITDVGENRAAEMTSKMDELASPSLRWHFVGHVQSNKVKDLVGRAAFIHSLDRMSLAERLSRRAVSTDATVRVLVQVNVAGEASKHGVDPDDVDKLAEDAARLPGIEVVGLMCIPPAPQASEDSAPYFAELARRRDRVARNLPSVIELSMGMSRDYEVAIAEGATMIRLGEAIFGPR